MPQEVSQVSPVTHFAAFWIRVAQSSENPVVTYKNKLFAELLFEDPNGGLKTYEYATLKPVRD